MGLDFLKTRVMLERKEQKIDGKNYEIIKFDNSRKQNSWLYKQLTKLLNVKIFEKLLNIETNFVPNAIEIQKFSLNMIDSKFSNVLIFFYTKML